MEDGETTPTTCLHATEPRPMKNPKLMYLRMAPVTLRYKFGDDVATERVEDNGFMWWMRAVESVPKEDMEEYMKGLSGLRDNLWTRIYELGGDPTMQINAQAFPSRMALVYWEMMDENLAIRYDQDEAVNGCICGLCGDSVSVSKP
ncbi:hypothetical protein Bca101_096534 [Brassica carinata]